MERTAKLAATAYADPTRTVATYARSVGLTATADAFVAAAVGLSDANWAAKFTAAGAVAYLRAGFTVK